MLHIHVPVRSANWHASSNKYLDKAYSSHSITYRNTEVNKRPTVTAHAGGRLTEQPGSECSLSQRAWVGPLGLVARKAARVFRAVVIVGLIACSRTAGQVNCNRASIEWNLVISAGPQNIFVNSEILVSIPKNVSRLLIVFLIIKYYCAVYSPKTSQKHLTTEKRQWQVLYPLEVRFHFRRACFLSAFCTEDVRIEAYLIIYNYYVHGVY